MIVQKVKPGVVQIIDSSSKGEIESYTLLDVTDKDAYLLLASAKNFKNDNGVITINYDAGDSTDSMFKAIAKKHKESGKNFTDVSKKYTIDKDIVIKGTSVLVRDVKKHTIRVAKRSTTNDTEGGINRLFISNSQRDAFFNDARDSQFRKEYGKFVIDSRDAELYKKWSEFMNNQYMKIIDIIKSVKNN